MARTLRVEIIGDASSLQRAFGNATDTSSRLGKTLASLGKVAAVGVGAAFVGLGLAVRRGFGEMKEGQQVAAQTAAGIKSTGGAANVTAKEISKLADSLSRMTGIDDEAVQAGENMLLTFTKVRNEVGKGNDIFNQATVAVADMATRMNDGAIPSMEQISQSSLRLGKALNDPIRGMGALSRVGVQFSDAQRTAITAMVESGDVMGAQKIILAELTKEFGNSAKAAGDTLPGQLAKANNAFDQVTERLAVVLLPHLTKFLEFMLDHMPQIEAVMSGVARGISSAIDFIAAAFRVLAEAARRHWAEVQAAAEGVTKWYQGNLLPTWNSLMQNFVRSNQQGGNEAGRGFTDGMLKHYASMPPLVRVQMENLVSVVNAILAVLRGDWATAWQEIKEIPVRGLKALLETIKLLGAAFLSAARAIGLAVVRGIAEGAQGLGQAVVERLGALVEVVRGIPGRIVSALGNLGSLLYNAGVQIIQGLINGITAKLGELWGLAGSIGGKIAGLKGPIEKDRQLLEPQGAAIIEGLMVGMQSRLPELEGLVSGIGPKIAEGLKGFGGGLGGAMVGVGLTLPPPDIIPTTDALATVAESTVEATVPVTTFRDLIASLPSVAAEAFTAVTKLILKAVAPLAKALEDPRAAIAAVADELHRIGRAAYATRAALQDTVDDIIRLLNRIGGAGGNLTGRASGGPVKAGSAYIVGEAGPELFIPKQSGTVVAGSADMGAAVGGNITFNFPNYVGSRQELIDEVRRGLYDVSRRNPGALPGVA